MSRIKSQIDDTKLHEKAVRARGAERRQASAVRRPTAAGGPRPVLAHIARACAFAGVGACVFAACIAVAVAQAEPQPDRDEGSYAPGQLSLRAGESLRASDHRLLLHAGCELGLYGDSGQ